jgi:hypothetical protein
VTGHDPSRVSPFGYPRIKAWSTAPRGFSQPPTSFIGIWRQGIHRWLLIAWEFTCTVSFKDARARSAILKGRARSCAGRNSEHHLPEADRVLELDAGRSTYGPRRRRGRAARPGDDTDTPGPSGREALRVRGCVAAPSKRNSDAPAGLGVRWCRQPPVSLGLRLEGWCWGRTSPRPPNNQ